MPYAHDWQNDLTIRKSTWKLICLDAGELIKAHPGSLLFLNIDADEIFFRDGDGQAQKFHLLRPRFGFEFCRTKGQFYDRLVCAILIAATDRHKELAVTSVGGDYEDGEDNWDVALKWATEILRRPLLKPWSQPVD
jgi:hypothetical protein